MNKIIMIVIAFYIVVAGAIGYVIYLGVSEIQEHGLKSIIEQIWEGPEKDYE